MFQHYNSITYSLEFIPENMEDGKKGGQILANFNALQNKESHISHINNIKFKNIIIYIITSGNRFFYHSPDSFMGEVVICFDY